MTDITLEALKLRSRELEMDAVMIRGRVEEIHRLIYEMERRRGGRPRKLRVAGAAHEPETDEDVLAALETAEAGPDDLQGILRTGPVEAA